MAVEPFKINVPDSFLELTTQKLNLTRFVEQHIQQQEGKEWDDGTPAKVVEELVEYWKSGSFDWRLHEAHINKQLPQYTTPVEVDGFGTLKIHFVWMRSPRTDAVPLLLCHGWPGSFYEFSKVLTPLTSPGDSSLPAFHCVVPSIPGYGFSEAPKTPGFGLHHAAVAYDQLMKRLGYPHYLAHGGDWGHGIVRCLCLLSARPSVLAIHSTWTFTHPPSPIWQPMQWGYMMLGFLTGGWIGLDKKYCGSLLAAKEFFRSEMAYYQIQATKPLSLAWSMGDSPAGLLAWLREKLHTWTDEYPWNCDEVFIWWMLYWYPGPYQGFRWYKECLSDSTIYEKYSPVPIGLSCFPKEIITSPHWWTKKLHPIKFTRVHDCGGHFAAWENPVEFVADLRDYFGEIIAERDELKAPRLNE